MKQTEPTEVKVSVRLPVKTYREAKLVAYQHYEQLDTLIPKLLDDYIKRQREVNGEA